MSLKVIKTMPGVKGNTVSGALKPATLETGVIIQVPLFIKEGDRIKIDTREKKYIERE
jgi:elongation factor P